MRVLLLAPFENVHSQRFLDWLQRANCEVIAMDGTRPANLAAGNSFVRFPTGFPLFIYTTMRRFARWVPLTRFRQQQIYNAWKRFKPDIVHVHSVDTKAFECAEIGVRPLVFTSWGTDINRLFTPDADQELAKRSGSALAKTDFVFADSSEVLERCNILAGKPIRSQLLRLGIDTTRFQSSTPQIVEQWRRKLNIPGDAKVVLSVRAMRREHRHDEILLAIKRAQARMQMPIVLVFKPYNPNERNYENELLAKVEAEGMSSQVRWVETVEYSQMPALYGMSDLVVNFPRRDGFPVSFLEAAACGSMLVTSRLPAYLNSGLEDFFRMVDPESTQELENAIVESLSEANDMKLNRSRAARAWSKEHGDERACAHAVIRVYESLVAEAPPIREPA